MGETATMCPICGRPWTSTKRLRYQKLQRFDGPDGTPIVKGKCVIACEQGHRYVAMVEQQQMKDPVATLLRRQSDRSAKVAK